MCDRDNLIYEAKLSEKMERFDDMVKFMSKVAKLGKLTLDERNLLSVAYKNVIGARRASWRILTSIEDKDIGEQKAKWVKEYKDEIEEELSKICNEILEVLNDHLLENDNNTEARVFYYKMKGDYLRYLTEYKTALERKVPAENSLEAYKTATELAAKEMPPTHPIRLGLALNFSVFYYEILNSPEQACRLAKTAFDDAISELDALKEDSYKDSTLIMQLLRDNLTLWTSEANQTDGEGEKSGDVVLEDVEADDVKAGAE